ncbi:MAG: DUF5606 domain-containing protein [Ferruginibacter sp.]|nr:DUF5606 domain-containing protein [Ferruginibacter sp.]
MDYNKLVTVTGLGGLFELVSSRTEGGVVRSLEDKSTKFVSNRIHQFSHLESIEVYTIKENINLADVFLAMQGSNEAIPGDKEKPEALKAYFEKVLPDLDFDRVYMSDMKKMVRWYNIITNNNITIKKSEDHHDNEAEGKKVTNKPVVEPKAASVKNAPAKKVNAPRKMA